MGHCFRNRSDFSNRSDKLADGTRRLGMAANTKRTWSVDLRVQPSRELLFWCLNQQSCDRLLVVVRMVQGEKGGYSTPRELEELPNSLFGSGVLEKFLASAWP